MSGAFFEGEATLLHVVTLNGGLYLHWQTLPASSGDYLELLSRLEDPEIARGVQHAPPGVSANLTFEVSEAGTVIRQLQLHEAHPRSGAAPTRGRRRLPQQCWDGRSIDPAMLATGLPRVPGQRRPRPRLRCRTGVLAEREGFHMLSSWHNQLLITRRANGSWSVKALNLPVEASDQRIWSLARIADIRTPEKLLDAISDCGYEVSLSPSDDEILETVAAMDPQFGERLRKHLEDAGRVE